MFKLEGNVSNFADLFTSVLPERSRMGRYKPPKAHEGIHKSPLCSLGHTVPNFSWADVPYVSLVIK